MGGGCRTVSGIGQTGSVPSSKSPAVASVGRVRPAVDALPAYKPGKAAEQAEREHNIAEAVKLASNENPYPPPAAVVEAVAEACRGGNLYCDHRAIAVREALADRLDLAVEQITVGAGSVALLYQLATAYVDPGDEVVTPWISFEAYPIAVQTMGREAGEGAADGGATPSTSTPWREPSPSAPSSCFWPPPTTPPARPCRPRPSHASWSGSPPMWWCWWTRPTASSRTPPWATRWQQICCHRFANVAVARTFSKAYGLASLRVGYVMAHPEITSAIDKCLIPFNVNGLAQAAALAALGDDAAAEAQANIDAIRVERGRVAAALTDDGWDIPDAQANFVWIHVGDRTDEACIALEQRGVVVRPFSGVGVRVTIGTPAQNDRFLATLAEVAQPA